MRMRPDTVTSAADTAAGSASPQVSARRHRPPRTSPNWQPHQSSREGWDFNPNTSTDSLPGTGRIIRRFRFQDSASGDRPLEKRLPQISFFDVKMDPKSLSPRAQNGATDKRNPPAIIPSKRDYLRVYYSDFLGQEEPQQEDRPQFVDPTSETSIESDELQNWVLQIQPRARTEVYPLYLLTKDILRRVATNKCRIINSRLAELTEKMRALTDAKARDDAAAKETIQGLQREVADLHGALADEQAKAKGGSEEDMRRLHELERSHAAVVTELETANKSAAQAVQVPGFESRDSHARRKADADSHTCTNAPPHA